MDTSVIQIYFALFMIVESSEFENCFGVLKFWIKSDFIFFYS